MFYKMAFNYQIFGYRKSFPKVSRSSDRNRNIKMSRFNWHREVKVDTEVKWGQDCDLLRE